MSTNFYAKIKMTDRNVARLKSYVEDMTAALNAEDYKQFDDVLDDLSYVFNNIKKETIIHLGKRSGGWAFLWDLNNMKFYKPELKSIISFLQKNNVVIEDEYGRQFSVDDFINNEIKYCLYPSSKPITEEELMQDDNIPDYQKQYILDNYINKGISYYKYCTSITFHEMHPDEPIHGFWNNSMNNFSSQCQPYAVSTIKHCDSDFVTKDNIRCALFTDFS